jgi:pimeloyl-ACP methyl ester carboxylesterase
MSHVTTKDNVRLYVKDWGQGRPIILLHGWPLSADSFDDLSLAVASAGMRAISYDRRGFGRSEQPWSGYDYNTLADDLAAVIAATGVQDATLLGFSMGGGEVARYMSRHGGKQVAQAVLVSSIVPYMLKTDSNPHGTDQATFDAMTQQMKQDRAKFWTTFFKQFYGVGVISHPVSEELLDWSRNVAMEASLKAALDCAAAFATTDFRPDLKAFNVPTLVIHGTADKTVPIDASGRAAAAGIAGAKLLEYDGAPHGLIATHKERCITDVVSFLQSFDAGSVRPRGLRSAAAS